jgi:hypothetical protein
MVKTAILEIISDLTEKPFGWDGDTGLPIRPDVATTITDRLFSSDSPVNLGQLSEPDITLCEDGTVEFVFEFAGRELIISVMSDLVVMYLKVYEGGSEEDGICRLDTPIGVSDLVSAFDWIKEA